MVGVVVEVGVEVGVIVDVPVAVAVPVGVGVSVVVGVAVRVLVITGVTVGVSVGVAVTVSVSNAECLIWNASPWFSEPDRFPGRSDFCAREDDTDARSKPAKIPTPRTNMNILA